MTTAKPKPRTPGDPSDHSDQTTDLAVRDAADMARQAEGRAQARAKAADAERTQASPESEVAALRAEVAAMRESQREIMMANRALLAQVRGQAQDMPAEEVRPTVASMQEAHDAGDLDKPVLCQEGWLVPPITSSNPVQQLAVAMRAETPADARARTEAAIAKGKKEAVKAQKAERDEAQDQIRATARSLEQTAHAAAKG